jgi:hypothetical protein
MRAACGALTRPTSILPPKDRWKCHERFRLPADGRRGISSLHGRFDQREQHI